MKLTNRIKTGLAVGATLLSLSVFVAAQPHGRGIGFGAEQQSKSSHTKTDPAPETTLVGRKGNIETDSALATLTCLAPSGDQA